MEVVNATAAELSKIPYTLPEGLYVVGSGSTGAAEAMAVMGVGYFSLMMASALTIKKPHPNYTVDATPADASAANNQVVATPPVAIPAVPDYSIEEVMRDKRFYQLGVALSCMAMGGFGLFAVAKPMMSEIFSSNLPLIVTSAFASKYVMALSGGNLGGRLGWAAVSDLFGRRNTFTFLTLCSMPVYLVLPTLVDTVISTGEALPLYAFCGMTVLAVSAVGGAFSVLPGKCFYLYQYFYSMCNYMFAFLF
ncbi:hypothetical protein EON64_17465 [archaeon]|nr:MAG: hypothetical protein EON64_17465 [archaeon]